MFHPSLHVHTRPLRRLLMVVVGLAGLTGCRTFSHYFYIGMAAMPEMDGTWYGKVVPVTQDDITHKPFPTTMAGLTIMGGRVDYVQKSGMGALQMPPGTVTCILSRDGYHALPFSDFAPDTWVEVRGTMFPQDDLKSPDGGAVFNARFIQIQGKASVISPRPGTPVTMPGDG